ncbi:MAG: hypothetical protein IJY97_00025 [Clostridia bacterium]|nr:hypothetical protein [Clostridia bacterium]
MKLLKYEVKKLFRSAGFVYLCVGILILNLLSCIFTPSFVESDGYIENYESNIAYVIRVAERNLLEYEATVGDENYIVCYQRDVIDRYTNLLDNGVSPEEVRGWNEFFENRYDDLLLILAAVIAGVLLTMTEWDNGTHRLALMTAKGRKSIRAKLFLFALFSIAAVIIMTAVSLMGIALRFGLSDPTSSLCSVEIFAYCPYDLSILDYLFITVPLKAANLFMIALISALTAALARSYLMGFLVPGGVVAVGYALSSVNSSKSFVLLNPYTSALCDPLFERYRSLNFFERSLPLLTALCVMLVAVCVLLSVLYTVSLSRGIGNTPFAKLEKSISSGLSKAKDVFRSLLPRRAPKRHSLLFSEAKKCFIKSHLILLCILMLGVKVLYSSSTAPEVHGAEEYYRDVCTALGGELTDEKRAHIDEVLAECAEILSKADSMRLAMQSGSITGEEYSAYLDEYSRASVEQYAYMKLSAQRTRIDRASTQGVDARITYDSGWIALFSEGFDLLLYALLLLFFCGIYETEYKNGFECIARTSAKGMHALDKSKIALAVIVTAVAFAVFSAVDMIFLLRTYTLPNAEFSFASVSERVMSTPIWCIAAIKYTAGVIMSVLFSVTICLISRFFKKIYLVIPVGGAVIALLYAVI